MPFGSYEPSEPAKVPTFLQYVKTTHKGVEGKTKFTVDIIWLPNKFNNVTLQTHAFRYICDENHPLFSDTNQYCLELLSRGTVPTLQIVITSVEKKLIEVIEDPKKTSTWVAMGSSAFKATHL